MDPAIRLKAEETKEDELRGVACHARGAIAALLAFGLGGCGTERTVSAQASAAAKAGKAARSCPAEVRSLGQIAFTTRRGLELLDLASCRVRTLPVRGAAGPRFSPDGRWLAYTQLVDGKPTRLMVMPVGGGRVRAPLGGGIQSWSWGPRGAVLYGLTTHGSLVAAVPAGPRRKIAAHLADAEFAVSAGGRSVVIDRSVCEPTLGELDRIDLRTGARTVLLKESGRVFTVAGWSPDGRWLLFWSARMCSASLNADGWPLQAIPASGGRPVRVIGHMLLYPDFLTWCGRELIAAGGPRSWRLTGQNSALLRTMPPAWRSRTLDPARTLSWVSPSCAPGGHLLAAAAGPNTGNAGFGFEHRSVWLLRADGVRVRRLAPPPGLQLSDEAPRFSADGRWIMFVRTRVVPVGQAAISRDQIMLVPITGGPAVPILRFTSSDFSYYDHFGWPYEIDWSGASRP